MVTYSFDNKDARQKANLLVNEYRYRGIPVTALRHLYIPGDINTRVADVDILCFAREFLSASRFDLVHLAHGMRLGSIANAAQESNVPTLYTITDFWTLCPKINLQTSGGALCGGPNGGAECSRFCAELDRSFVQCRLGKIKDMLTRANAIATPSRFVRSILRAELGDIKVQVIPHGIARPQMLPLPKAYRANNKLVFGYAGGLAPHKGVHILLAAFRRLNGEAELRVYGDDTENSGYVNLLRKVAKADPRIRFCGAYTDDQVDSVFSELDVLVVPSLCYETYSFSAHEALAHSVPVIASRLGSLVDTIQEGINGFTVRAGDVEDLANQLQQITDHSERLNDLRAKLDDSVPPMVEEEAYIYQRLYNEITKDVNRQT